MLKDYLPPKTWRERFFLGFAPENIGKAAGAMTGWLLGIALVLAIAKVIGWVL